jgi:hypothetical protein
MTMSFRGSCFYSCDWTSVLRLYLYLFLTLYCVLKMGGNDSRPHTYDYSELWLFRLQGMIWFLTALRSREWGAVQGSIMMQSDTRRLPIGRRSQSQHHTLWAFNSMLSDRSLLRAD